jgi:hypothetical protein
VTRSYGEGTYGSGTYGGVAPAVPPEAGIEEIDARRAFPEAQRLLGGLVFERVASRASVGWHGGSTSEQGSFAVVRRGGPYVDLVGEVLRVAAGGRESFVVVLESADVTEDLSLARRPFLNLAYLSTEILEAEVGIV